MKWLLLCALLGAMGMMQGNPKKDEKVVMNFEKDTHGWQPFYGTDGKVDRVTNPNDVKNGTGALQYTFTTGKDKLNLLYHTEPEYYAKGFRFWVKTNRPTGVVFILSEENSERWQAIVWCGHNQWQQVTLALSDFALAEDSPKGNGKIDMEKLDAMGFLDLMAMLGGMPDSQALLGTTHSGTHMLWLDDFEFLEKEPVRNAKSDALDEFHLDHLTWLAFPNITLKKSAGGLQAHYKQEIPALFAVMKGIPLEALSKAKGIELKMATKFPTDIALVLEEMDGERWMVMLEMGNEKEKSDWKKIWSDFAITDDTKGKGNNKLEPGKVKMMSLIDFGVIAGESEPSNTWDVQSVKMLK